MMRELLTIRMRVVLCDSLLYVILFVITGLLLLFCEARDQKCLIIIIIIIKERETRI